MFIFNNVTQVEVIYTLVKFHITTLRTGLRYIRTSISAQKTAVFGCLTNALGPLLIALESCSMAQTDRPV